MSDSAARYNEECARREVILEKLEEAERRTIEIDAQPDGTFKVRREDLALLMNVRTIAAPLVRELLRDLAHHAPVTLH